MSRLRPSWDMYFIQIAEVVSRRSHDDETQVGAVIVNKNRHIVSTGYNGFPPGFPDESLPTTRPAKYPLIIHAEANAIAHAQYPLIGCTIYCTHYPCGECSKLILAAGITRVCYRHKYLQQDPENLLERGGIEIVHIQEIV